MPILYQSVPPEVWNFHIGGYQVCEKWLKDRRERTLSYDDLEHYAKVVTALQETIHPMAALDAALRLSLRAVSASRTAIPRWPLE